MPVYDKTDAQKRAMKWLSDRGGSGVLDRYGRVMAAGEVASHIHPTTWLRLMTMSEVGGALKRIYLVVQD